MAARNPNSAAAYDDVRCSEATKRIRKLIFEQMRLHGVYGVIRDEMTVLAARVLGSLIESSSVTGRMADMKNRYELYELSVCRASRCGEDNIICVLPEVFFKMILDGDERAFFNPVTRLPRATPTQEDAYRELHGLPPRVKK